MQNARVPRASFAPGDLELPVACVTVRALAVEELTVKRECPESCETICHRGELCSNPDVRYYAE
jgi:hypothetical protein